MRLSQAVLLLVLAIGIVACQRGSAQAGASSSGASVTLETAPTASSTAVLAAVASTDTESQPIVDRIKPAIERQETSGHDCSGDGCPARTANPAHQPASYGWTQMTINTTLGELASVRGVPDCVGVSDDDVAAALQRSQMATTWFKQISSASPAAPAPAQFLADTQLSATDYADIVYWKQLQVIVQTRVPNRSPDALYAQIIATSAGARLPSLLAAIGMSEVDLRPYLRLIIWSEAQQAYAAKAALGNDGVFRQRILSFYMTKACYDQVSDRMMAMKVTSNEAHWPTFDGLPDARYDDVVAALVAFNHNAGHVWGAIGPEHNKDPRTPPTLSANFVHALWCFPYVASFFKIWSGQPVQCS